MVDRISELSEVSITPEAGASVPPEPNPALPPLTWGEKFIFSTGDTVSGIKDTAIGTFLLFYLTAVCGLSGTLAGLAVFVSLAVDAVADPMIGYLSDSTKSRWGRRHPYMVLSMVPLAVAFTLLFAVPDFDSQLLLFLYATGILICVRIAHSAFTLPFIALSAEVSRDYRERSQLGAVRSLFNTLGNVVTVVLAFSVFLKGENRLNHDSYIWFGITCALLAMAAGLLCSFGTYSWRHRMHEVAQHERPSLARFGLEIGDVARNNSFRILFATVLIFWVAQGVAGALNLHIFLYFWRLPDSVIQSLPIITAVGLVIGIFTAAALLRFFEKQQVSVVGLGLFCLLQVLPIGLRLAGVFTVEGPPLYAILSVIAFINGLVITAVGISFGAMMADTADEHEWLFGSRREGLYFAGLTFSAKAAVGLGAFGGGIALDLVGFPRDLASLGPNPQIAADVVRDLGIAAGPVSGIVAAVSVIILAGYRLDAKKHAQIQFEIAARKTPAAPPDTAL